MTVEVTKETFNAVFNKAAFMGIEKKETYERHLFYSSKNDQKGIIIKNYIGGIVQHYIFDINF